MLTKQLDKMKQKVAYMCFCYSNISRTKTSRGKSSPLPQPLDMPLMITQSVRLKTNHLKLILYCFKANVS